MKHLALSLFLALGMASPALSKTVYKTIPTQYIAALGDKTRTSGDGAETWGLWQLDPGPRGVKLAFFPLLSKTGIAPAMWKFEAGDWWLEEHGLIMEAPQFPMPEGRYVVTGGREKMALLTVEANGKWSLDSGATLYDVTHLGCRAARYRPETAFSACTPANVPPEQFPIRSPGARMPETANCNKLDYQVLIVVGMALEE
jgi:hypothetical protein